MPSNEYSESSRRSAVTETYRERLAERGKESERRKRSVAWVSYARLALFAAAVAVAWFVWETDRVSWPWLLLPISGFATLVVIHARLNDAWLRSRRAEDFHRRGMARMEGRWAGDGAAGEAFLSDEHPYARDLDLFGKGSLFELLATTESAWGAATLADWLLEAAEPEEIRLRQAAVRELAPMLELRESIASEHEPVGEGVDPDVLGRWAAAPPGLTSSAARWIAALLGLLMLGLVIGWLASWVPRVPVLLALAAGSLFAGFYRAKAREVIASVEGPAGNLAVLSTLLDRFESARFTSVRLKALQGALEAEGEPASQQIRRLNRRIDFLDARRNQLFAPVAALLLWGTQFAFALEAWRRTAGPSVPRWLRAVGELDALLALATYAYEHPDDPFPEIDEAGPGFDAKGLGHPLIPEDRLVRNDVRFGHGLRLLVVSGSNMSGKSTLLRAIGVNAVLAFSGAPVRAHALVLSPFRIAASIRIQDSLQDGISHFYAEILRLRQVTELAGGGTTLLFLLDEILQGTNSHDRRIGAEAVVRNLVGSGAHGLITTHDLALARMAETLGEKAENVHFEDQIENGKIRFDYVMRPGVVKKSNALELMRSVGLRV